MGIDIESITKIINQVTGLNFTPRHKWTNDNGYRFYDDEHFDIYITVDEIEDIPIFTVSQFDKDMQLVNALQLVYPNARIWITRYA